jgi:hypothetical protein
MPNPSLHGSIYGVFTSNTYHLFLYNREHESERCLIEEIKIKKDLI